MDQLTKVSQKNQVKNSILKEIGSFTSLTARKTGYFTSLEAYDRKLFLANRPFSLTAEEYIGMWATLMAVALVSAVVLTLTGVIQPLFAVFLVAIGVLMPHVYVNTRAEVGRNKLSSSVIDLVGRLELGTSAGISPVRVLEWVSEGSGLLADLLKTLTKEVAMGKMTHIVFTRLADDYGIPEARDVAVALKQAEVQGLPISQVLSELSHNLRESRERDAEIQVVKLRPSIEGILTATMMIAAIALMLGPIAAENLSSLNTMFGGGF